AVHGQTDQQRLLKPARQRAALDRYAGAAVAEPLARYQTAYRRLREVEAELLRYGLEEVAAAEPVAAEDVELAAEAERLGHADALASAAQLAHGALAGDPAEPDILDAGTLIAQARRALEAVRHHDGQLA